MTMSVHADRLPKIVKDTPTFRLKMDLVSGSLESHPLEKLVLKSRLIQESMKKKKREWLRVVHPQYATARTVSLVSTAELLDLTSLSSLSVRCLMMKRKKLLLRCIILRSKRTQLLPVPTKLETRKPRNQKSTCQFQRQLKKPKRSWRKEVHHQSVMAKMVEQV